MQITAQQQIYNFPFFEIILTIFAYKTVHYASFEPFPHIIEVNDIFQKNWHTEEGL